MKEYSQNALQEAQAIFREKKKLEENPERLSDFFRTFTRTTESQINTDNSLSRSLDKVLSLLEKQNVTNDQQKEINRRLQLITQILWKGNQFAWQDINRLKRILYAFVILFVLYVFKDQIRTGINGLVGYVSYGIELTQPKNLSAKDQFDLYYRTPISVIGTLIVVGLGLVAWKKYLENLFQKLKKFLKNHLP